jgi:hypothetical protein
MGQIDSVLVVQADLAQIAVLDVDDITRGVLVGACVWSK